MIIVNLRGALITHPHHFTGPLVAFRRLPLKQELRMRTACPIFMLMQSLAMQFRGCMLVMVVVEVIVAMGGDNGFRTD